MCTNLITINGGKKVIWVGGISDILKNCFNHTTVNTDNYTFFNHLMVPVDSHLVRLALVTEYRPSKLPIP